MLIKYVSECIRVKHDVQLHLSEGNDQKLRQESHFTSAGGTWTSSCRTLSKMMSGAHISSRLRVSADCSCRRAIFCFICAVRGRPSALQWVVRHKRSVSLNDAKACFWLAVCGSSKAPSNTYDIAPLDRRTKSTALSLKVLSMKLMLFGIQFCSPPRSLLLLLAVLSFAGDSAHPRIS